MNLLVITGASAGIGQATARLFVDAGWSVVNLSRRPCPVAGVINIASDLAEPDFAEAASSTLTPMVRDAARTVLIHNAGRLGNDSVDAMPGRDLRAVLEVNVVAASALNQVVLPHMAKGSAVLYVGSTLSEKAVPGCFSYVVSKHAVIGMMRATVQDLAGRGIHSACICPGFTDTEMLRAHIPEDALEGVAAMSAYGRLVAPEEIARVLRFAADEPAVNGTVLHANLGQVER